MILKKRVFFKNLRGLERICEGTARVSARVKAQCLRHPEGCEGKIRKKIFFGGWDTKSAVKSRRAVL